MITKQDIECQPVRIISAYRGVYRATSVVGYIGKRTPRAIQARLNREIGEGQRWADAQIQARNGEWVSLREWLDASEGK